MTNNQDNQADKFSNYRINSDRLWDSLMEMAKIGATAERWLQTPGRHRFRSSVKRFVYKLV